MRRSIEAGVYKRAAFSPNGLLKVRCSIEGRVYQRAAFIRGNTLSLHQVKIFRFQAMIK